MWGMRPQYMCSRRKRHPGIEAERRGRLRWASAADSLKIVAMHTLLSSLRLVGRVFLIAGGIGLAMAGDSGNQESIRLSRETCTSLQGFSVPASAIGLPTAVHWFRLRRLLPRRRTTTSTASSAR